MSACNAKLGAAPAHACRDADELRAFFVRRRKKFLAPGSGSCRNALRFCIYAADVLCSLPACARRRPWKTRMPDAPLAPLVIERGAILGSTDGDFGRFGNLRCRVRCPGES